MATVLFVLIAVTVSLATLVAVSWCVDRAHKRAAAAHLARLEQLRAERRIQQLTQAAVQQLLDAARHGR